MFVSFFVCSCLFFFKKKEPYLTQQLRDEWTHDFAKLDTDKKGVLTGKAKKFKTNMNEKNMNELNEKQS